MTKDSCPSDLVVDRYLAEELAAAGRASLEAHLQGCDDCRARIEARRVDAADYAARSELPERAAAVLAAVGRQDATREAKARLQPWWRSFSRWAPGLAVAAAVAVLIVMMLPREALRSGAGREGVRVKGSLSIGAYLKRSETVSEARSGQAFFPGDRLRFNYSARRDGYLCLIGVDARRAVTVYFPSRGDRAFRAKKGSKRALPESTILDDTLGLETVAGILCPERFAPSTLRASARKLIEALRKGKRAAAIRLLPAPDCQTALFELQKARRGGR